jgi:hypothetical protein
MEDPDVGIADSPARVYNDPKFCSKILESVTSKIPLQTLRSKVPGAASMRLELANVRECQGNLIEALKQGLKRLSVYETTQWPCLGSQLVRPTANTRTHTHPI